MPVFWWSKTSSDNGNSDPTINFLEGQTPGSLNDSGRAMIAALKKYVDDISGAIVTTGTSTAYAVTSYSVFDTLAHLNGQMIAFTPHTTNAATVTLNVDGLGAKPLRSAPSTELLAGVLIQGTPYVATYNNSDAVWYLQNFYGNPYNIPLGGMLDFTLATAPNSSFVFPFGQAISRTTYSALFAAMGSTFGSGDGSTTFNIPDLRGRFTAGVDNMGGSGASRISGATLSVAAGAQSVTVAQNQLPNVTLSYSNSISVTSTSSSVLTGTGVNVNLSTSTGTPLTVLSQGGFGSSAIGATGTSSGNTSSINGNTTQQTLSVLPPYIAVNKILRII